MLLERNDGIFICPLELCTSERNPNQEVRDGVKVKSRNHTVVAGLGELLLVVANELQVAHQSDAREPENGAGVCVHVIPLCGR